MSVAKGILVYATGKTETCEPEGLLVIKRCECCGSELYFRCADKMALDKSSVLPGSQEEEKLRRYRALERARPFLNEGCVVYIQQKDVAV